MKKVIFCWCKGQDYRMENCRQQGRGAAGSNPGEGTAILGVNPHWKVCCQWGKSRLQIAPFLQHCLCGGKRAELVENVQNLPSPTAQNAKEPPCSPQGPRAQWLPWPSALPGDTGRDVMGRAGPRVASGREEQGGRGSTCTCTRIESLHVAGTRRAFACRMIQSALVIIAWANPARRRVLCWAC